MWYNAFDNTKFIEQGYRSPSWWDIRNWPISRTGYHFECNFFFKRFPNLETRAAHTHPNHSQIPPRGGLHPMCPLIKTLRWDDLRQGGNVSKIIFLRVLSGHLSISRFDRLSRFLNHNYEIDFSGNSWSIYIYYSRPATCDPQSVTCDLRPADNRPAGSVECRIISVNSCSEKIINCKLKLHS